MRTTLYDYCTEHGELSLLRQWHPLLNAPLTPHTIACGSSRKVWWRCEKGHEWQAAVYPRVGRGSGCPYCTGKRAWPGENDLASQRPDLAAQWDGEKNAPLTPDSVTTGSHRMIWWRCEKGHQWRAMIKTRVAGCGCPICTNRELLPGVNDLATTRPELAAQWDKEKNGSLTPSQVVAGTRRRVWWRCEKGHQWQSLVASRADGAGCPICAGKQILPGENDFASSFPGVAAQWHPKKNGSLRPSDVAPTSNRRVWWRCPVGHDYPAVISARTAGATECPYCTGRKVFPGFNDLQTLQPALAAQWHPTLNGSLTPEMVTIGSHRKIWWRCADGHVWKAVVYARAGPQRSGCPVCAGRVKLSRAEYYAALSAKGPPPAHKDDHPAHAEMLNIDTERGTPADPAAPPPLPGDPRQDERSSFYDK